MSDSVRQRREEEHSSRNPCSYSLNHNLQPFHRQFIGFSKSYVCVRKTDLAFKLLVTGCWGWCWSWSLYCTGSLCNLVLASLSEEWKSLLTVGGRSSSLSSRSPSPNITDGCESISPASLPQYSWQCADDEPQDYLTSWTRFLIKLTGILWILDQGSAI